jgi:hypothetical protein
MTENFWTFAIDINGDLHVWQDTEMPAAVNVVRVPVRLDGDLVRIAPADLAAIRHLVGQETREVIVPTGPHAADELEDLLTRINVIAQSRIDELRGDAEEGDLPAPRM